MKICFLIASLSSGGSERVVSLLANSFADDNEVKIITWDNSDSFYVLDESIKHVKLNLEFDKSKDIFHFYFNIKRIRALRKLLVRDKPDVLISFIVSNNVLAILSSRHLGIKTIISERSSLYTNKIPKIWFVLRKITYCFSDILVFQSRDALDFALKNKIRAKRNVIIQNPIVLNDSQIVAKKQVVLFVGRLSKEKRVEDLINAFDGLLKYNRSYSLWIVGDGPEKHSLIQLANKLGISENIVFWGRQKDTIKFYEESKIFVLPSSSEGFPNVLLEAMNYNCLVISSRYSDAVEEILQMSENGLLYEVGNVKKLENTLVMVTNDWDAFKPYISNAKNQLIKFSIDDIAEKWMLNINEINEFEKKSGLLI